MERTVRYREGVIFFLGVPREELPTERDSPPAPDGVTLRPRSLMGRILAIPDADETERDSGAAAMGGRRSSHFIFHKISSVC